MMTALRERAIVSSRSAPSRPRHVRIQYDPVRQAFAVLSPEKVFWPNEVSLDILRRCDGMASADVRNQPEFRRLIDGAIASLALVPKAVRERDGDLLHRLLIELRSFDNLLAFRYG